ncbi:MAG: hypothetical protein HYV76_03160 [Candidatus Vogelbacteria bacterium]|nr:hypothetical protein [Candidatus Vogelbacteria bacterium]
MKSILTLILIVSFAGIAVFGFTIFSHSMSESTSGCVTSPIDGTPCPTNIVAMTLQHVSALQTLTTSVTSSISSWILLLAFILLVSFSISIFYKNLLFPKLELLHQRLRDLVFNSFYSKQKITSWLSLFENSPAF